MLGCGNLLQFSRRHGWNCPWHRASTAAVSEFGLACVGKGLVLRKKCINQGEPWSTQLFVWLVCMAGRSRSLGFLANIQPRFFVNVSGYFCSGVLHSIFDWVLLLAFLAVLNSKRINGELLWCCWQVCSQTAWATAPSWVPWASAYSGSRTNGPLGRLWVADVIPRSEDDLRIFNDFQWINGAWIMGPNNSHPMGYLLVIQHSYGKYWKITILNRSIA